MKRMTKAAFRTAVNLLFFTVIGTAILAVTYLLTHERIAATEDEARMKLISEVAPPNLYDNALLKDTIQVEASPLLGTDEPTPVYRGRMQGQPAVVILQAIAPDGYSGRISLIIAITAAGNISGVRVVSHKETPGLGDYIEILKSKWITLFNGKSFENTPEQDWKVKKDGGQFDYMSGATISPRAVVKAVNKALQYFAAHRETLFASAPQPATPLGEAASSKEATK